MDARPQRPFRALKARDENIPPAVPSTKTLQRGKSSPALSTLAQTHGLKLGPKRTAFADVSNTVRPLQIVKDDSVITTKSSRDVGQDCKVQDHVRPVALLRPAQRPLSISGIRGLLNNFTSTASSSVLKPIPVDARPEQTIPSAHTSKPLTKSSTIVFKETNPSSRELSALPSVAPHVHDLVLPSQQHFDGINEPRFEESIQSLAKEHSSLIHETRPETNIQSFIPLQADYQDIRSDSIHLYNTESLPQPYADENTQFDGSEIYVDASSHIVPEPEPGFLAEEKKSLTRITEKAYDLPQLLPVSELEEYWEEDGYDEHLEEDGYTTARSLKSKGDYTTGPTTVVLAPRPTAKVERELAAAKQTVLDSRSIDELEDDESWDTSMVAEYGEEIFDYMRTLEERMRPNPHYMDSQTEVQWSMRSVLMDWLVQVHHRFNLLPETLFLCVNYIDRFLSCKVVSLGKLQLVGATAIFVAAKYEEINCPSVSEIVYMVDGGYTTDEILKAERFMLSMLQFELGWPGPMSFLRRISKADDYDLETRTLAKYFLEITIMDERFVGCIPSYIAAGAHCLARLMLNKGTWSPAHAYYSNYTYSQLRPLLNAMLSCCEDPQKHHAAVYDKYGDKRFKRSSFFVQSEMNKGFLLPLIPRSSIPAYEVGAKVKVER